MSIAGDLNTQTTNETRRQGSTYVVSQEEVARFRNDGYVHLRGVLSADEMDEIERVYNAFLTRQISVPGKDFNDMTTGEFDSDHASIRLST